MHKVIKQAVLVFLFLFLAAVNHGCVKSAIMPEDVQAQNLYIKALNAIQEEKMISALARIDLVTSHGHYPMRAVIILKRPCYLRLEILSPLGSPYYFLAATPDNISIFDPSQSKYYEGRPTAENLSRFLPGAFRIEEVVMVLSGAFPMMVNDDVSFKGHEEFNHFFVEVESLIGGSQVVEFGENNRLLKFAQKNHNGQEVYNVQYGEYEKENVPGSIVVTLADGITSMRVKYYEFKVEENNDLSVFNLPVPEGVKTILLN